MATAQQARDALRDQVAPCALCRPEAALGYTEGA
ncbi:DUF6233 domain-containing protein [Streptomyces sp. NPDC048208]